LRRCFAQARHGFLLLRRGPGQQNDIRECHCETCLCAYCRATAVYPTCSDIFRRCFTARSTSPRLRSLLPRFSGQRPTDTSLPLSCQRFELSSWKELWNLKMLLEVGLGYSVPTTPLQPECPFSEWALICFQGLHVLFKVDDSRCLQGFVCFLGRSISLCVSGASKFMCFRGLHILSKVDRRDLIENR